MTDFPASPLPPAEFFEQWLPQRFAAAELTPALREADLSLGVVLRGEGGGEWARVSGTFTLVVGSSSRDHRLQADLLVP